MFESSFPGQTNLPQPDIFGKALYTIYIGQNDITHDVAALGSGGVKQYEPQISGEIVNAIKVTVPCTAPILFSDN